MLSQDDIRRRIAAGQKIIIFDGLVLRVDAWMLYHPGGQKAIEHMIGIDASDPINCYHSVETRWYMRRYAIGRISTSAPWKNLRPPIQGGIYSIEANRPLETLARSASSSSSSSVSESEESNTRSQTPDSVYSDTDADVQWHITIKYRELEQRMQDMKLFDCDYVAYAWEFARYVMLFTLFVVFLRHDAYTLSAICLGAFWHQLTFTAHDAGHLGITHSFTLDSVIGIFIADFCGGLSLGWWKRNHNVHHLVTNDPEHDPDIQHMPFFAISSRFLDSLRSTFYERVMTYDVFARYFLQVQHYLYYPILCFGRFNLYFLSWDYLIARRGPRKGPSAWCWDLELVGMAVFWAWFGYGVLYKSIPTTGMRLWFLVLSHMVTMPLHVQITLSHFAMSCEDLGLNESFAQKMLRTTMDVDCPPWLDFFHGGLQFQAVHHLFPRMPRHNLRKAQPYVISFCKEVGVKYTIYGFEEGNRKVIGALRDVAQQARYLADAAKHI